MFHFVKISKHRIVELKETEHFAKFGENVELNEGRIKRDKSVFQDEFLPFQDDPRS